MVHTAEYTADNPLKVITLCSGIDFQCQALDRLVKKYPPFSYDLAAWSEIDKYAITIHNLLYPQWKDRNLGDMTKIKWNELTGGGRPARLLHPLPKLIPGREARRYGGRKRNKVVYTLEHKGRHQSKAPQISLVRERKEHDRETF